MKSKGIRVETRTLADGTVKQYRYKRKPRATRLDQSIAGVIAAWQDSPSWEALKPNTQQGYVRYIHPLFQAMRQVPVKQVRRRHLVAIRDLIAKQRGHGAAIGFCRSVSAMFKWAIESDIVETSPAASLRTKLRQGTLPTWTNEQAQRAMRDLPEPYRRAVVLAYHTGQRRGDLCSLQWSAYDGTFIRMRQQKTNEALDIPVTPDLRAELDAWKRERRALTILETVRGVPWLPVYLSRMLPIELAKIGLPAELNMHGLRKLTAVRLAEAGCSAHEIAAITGHRTLSMVAHYTRAVNQRSLADVAMLRLDNQHKDAKGSVLPMKTKAR